MAPIAASTMLSGVAKSGSPISRWTMRLPSASSLRARASTSNAPSVPSRDMRSAKRIAVLAMIRMLVHAQERTAVDAKRLPADVRGLPGAEEDARGRELFGRAQPPHRGSLGHAPDVLCVAAREVA